MEIGDVRPEGQHQEGDGWGAVVKGGSARSRYVEW